MTWDYRQLCPQINWAEEGQGNEGGLNKYDNCVPAATLLCLQMLGYGDPMEPQDLTDAVYGHSYHGVEDLSAVYGYIQGRRDLWPNAPTLASADLRDMASWIEANGDAHKPMIYFVHCNSQAQIVAGGPYGHASVPVAGDGNSITLWANGFSGGTVTLSHAQINAVSYGGAALFGRPIQGGLSMADAASLEAQLKDIRALLGDTFNMTTDGTSAGRDSSILHGILAAAQQAANNGGGGQALPQDVQDAIKTIANHLK